MAAPNDETVYQPTTGRPPIYSDPKEVQEIVDSYFEYIKGEEYTPEEAKKLGRSWKRWPENPTVTGLTLYLGFESRSTLDEYAKKPEFSYIIKRAKLRVEMGYELRLDRDKPVGAIFALKNMGWKDSVENTLKNPDKVEGEEEKVFKVTMIL